MINNTVNGMVDMINSTRASNGLGTQKQRENSIQEKKITLMVTNFGHANFGQNQTKTFRKQKQHGEKVSSQLQCLVLNERNFQ